MAGMSNDFEADLASAYQLTMYDDAGQAQSAEWWGNMQVDDRTVAIIEFANKEIGFYLYDLDEDAVESFVPLPEDDVSLYHRCCAQLAAQLTESDS